MTGKDVMLKTEKRKKPPLKKKKKEKKKGPTKKSWTDNSQKSKAYVMYILKFCQISQ